MSRLTNLLAPVDLESIAWEALEYAGWLAAKSSGITDIFYVHPTSDAHENSQAEFCERLMSLIAILTEHFSRSHMSVIAGGFMPAPIFVGNMQPGDPATAILDFATRRHHDAIIMGTTRNSAVTNGERHSISETVLRQSNRPVLIVPERQRFEIPSDSRMLV